MTANKKWLKRRRVGCSTSTEVSWVGAQSSGAAPLLCRSQRFCWWAGDTAVTWAPTPKGVEVRTRVQSPSLLPLSSPLHTAATICPRDQAGLLTRLRPGRNNATRQLCSLPGPPSSTALSPLPSGGQTWQFFPPSGAGAVSGRVGKPAEQGGRSPNRLYRAVLSPPSRPVPLLPHRAEAAASRNQPFYYAVGGLGSVEGRGTGGGVMPESPGVLWGGYNTSGAVGQARPGLTCGGREEAASSHSSYPSPWH